MKINKFFTLIELIVVIAVLGILAAIIIPNISSFQEEANDTAITSNVRNLQTSVDMYGLENYGGVPTQNPPKEDVPQPIDFNKIYPDYTRDIPEEEGVKYWVDFQGKVWASTIDSPSDVTYNPGTLEWTGVENAAYYNIFKVVDNNASSSIKKKKTIFIKKLEDSSPNIADNTLPNLKTGEQYLVSAVDNKGFESAPVGTNYTGYVEVPFTGGESTEPQEEALVPVGTVYTFTNAGATGRYGPSQSQIDGTYNSTNLSGKVTSSNGIQLWTVPDTGMYRIEAYGAQGGAGFSINTGGQGAIIEGDVHLNQGSQIKILVGQQGLDSLEAQAGAGGGGGTFVSMLDNTPLVVAGGGGGGARTVYHGHGTGGPATITNDGDRSGNLGGNYGNGIGSGFSINGDSIAFTNGGFGGAHSYGETGGAGGFGGGAGNSGHLGGGGGGYTGGNGGYLDGTKSTGGGSYLISSATNTQKYIGNSGQGKVIITKLN